MFGKKFSEHLISSAKSKKQTIELFCDNGKKNRSPFDLAHQRHRGGALEGRKNSSSKRRVLVQRDNENFSADINKGVAATDKVKTNKKETFFNMSFSHVIPTSELENVHPLIRKLFFI